MSATVGLVIPAYRPALDRLERYVADLQDAIDPAEIRIELDDPERGVDAFADRVEATVATAPTRRGKGLAITAGFEALDADVLAFVDADGSTAPESVSDLVEAVTAGGADVAVGTRRHPGAQVATSPGPTRRLLSAGFVRLARVTTGLRLSDFQCGAKALDRRCWTAVRDGLYETGFGWDLEVLWVAAREDHAIEEVPIQWQDRPGSTVPPVRTTLGLSLLLGRIALARAVGRPHRPRDAIPILDRLEAGVG